jgi:AcrR family transcriptional regulator
MSADSTLDRRQDRTRQAITGAFITLLFERPYGQITVAALIERANVGRSTFYEHFTGKDDVFRQSVASPLSVVARATVADGDRAALIAILKHFRENQGVARVMLQTAARQSFTRVFASEVEAAFGDRKPVSRLSSSLVAAQISAALQAAMEPWILGQVPATAETLAEALCLTGRTMANGLLTR